MATATKSKPKKETKTQIRRRELDELTVADIIPAWATVWYVADGDDPTAAVDELLSRRGDGVLCFDVETNGVNFGKPDARCRTIQLGTADYAVVLSADDPVHVDAARRALSTGHITAHNASFDIMWLTQLGVFDSIDDAWKRCVDTFILVTGIEPPSLQPSKYRDLKNQSATHFPDRAVSARADELRHEMFVLTSWKDERLDREPPEKNGWAQVDSAHPVMVAYAAGDVLDGARLCRTLLPVARAAFPEAANTEHQLARIVCGMQYRGIRLDREWAEQRLAEARKDKAQAWDDLDLAATPAEQLPKPKTANADPDRVVTAPGSTALMAELFRAEGMEIYLSAKGAVSTTEEVLEGYAAAGSKVAEPLLRWRQADKVAGTYLEHYLTWGDRIHCDISTVQAKTGRMSASRPNLQNVPRKGGVRECFVADEDMVIISADFSSVEMRVAAALSGDIALRELYLTPDGDPYLELARAAYGPGATKEQRNAVKAFVLGRMYGGGVQTLSSNQGWSFDEGTRLIAVLDSTYPWLKWYGEYLKAQIATGYPGWVNEVGRYQVCETTSPHTVLNYRVQGLARDLLVGATIRADAAGLGPNLLVPIHDELLAQVPQDQAAEFAERLKALMATTLPVSEWALGTQHHEDIGQHLPDHVDIPADVEIIGPRWTKEKKPTPIEQQIADQD
jgi:DNA polymerase-1